MNIETHARTQPPEGGIFLPNEIAELGNNKERLLEMAVALPQYRERSEKAQSDLDSMTDTELRQYYASRRMVAEGAGSAEREAAALEYMGWVDAMAEVRYRFADVSSVLGRASSTIARLIVAEAAEIPQMLNGRMYHLYTTAESSKKWLLGYDKQAAEFVWYDRYDSVGGDTRLAGPEDHAQLVFDYLSQWQ